MNAAEIAPVMALLAGPSILPPPLRKVLACVMLLNQCTKREAVAALRVAESEFGELPRPVHTWGAYDIEDRVSRSCVGWRMTRRKGPKLRVLQGGAQ